MEGIERGSEENVRSESKWVDGSEADSESNPWSLMDEDQKEEHGSVGRRLFKNPKRVDSFDVEAMGIYDPHSHHRKDISIWSTLAMAFQRLGVVYGDMGASPLYVFVDVFSKVPIKNGRGCLGSFIVGYVHD